MKHFIDIQHVRGKTALTESNATGFVPGDIISVTEKIDGANASVTYEDGMLKAFSRKNELSSANTLRGFYEYTRGLNLDKFIEYANYIFFGEWLVRHAVRYAENAYLNWYVYDVFDKTTHQWMNQDFVKKACSDIGLNYVHVLYEGPFVSWDHIKELALLDSSYGAAQMEGVVVKNMSRLNSEDDRVPAYLKYVNEGFKETKARKDAPKGEDPERARARNEAYELLKTVCTKNRVRKELMKCVDEGLLVPPFSKTDLGAMARLIPKRVYEDLLKEERETVMQAGELAGKLANGITMNHLREILEEGGEESE